MAVAHVQSKSTYTGYPGSSPGNLAFDSNVTSGNLLVVGVGWHLAGTNASTVSDTLTNTWSSTIVYGPANGAESYAQVFWCIANGSGADTVTVTLGSGTNGLGFSIHEYSGINTTDAWEMTSAVIALTSGDPITSANITTTVNDSLIYAFVCNEGGNNYTAGTNYTLRTQEADHTHADEDRILTSTVSNQTASFAGTDDDKWVIVAVVFNGSGGGAPSINVYDNVGVVESISRLIPAYDLSVSDKAGVSESASLRITTLFIAVYDGVGVGEGVSELVPSYPLSTFDRVGVSESISELVPVYPLSVQDGVGVSESATAITNTYDLSVSDGIGVAESTSELIPSYSLSVSDNVVVVESMSELVPTYALSAYDKVGVSESQTELTNPYYISSADVVGVGESQTVSSGAVSNYSIDTYDLLGVSGGTQTNDPQIFVGELFSTQENISETVPSLGISTHEGVGVSEFGAERTNPLYANVYENVGVVESQTETIGTLSVSVNDRVGVAEFAGELIPVYSLSVSELMGESESATSSIPSMSINVYEVVGTGEGVGEGIGGSVNLSVYELVGVGEGRSELVPQLYINVADKMGTGETIMGTPSAALINISELIGLKEAESSLIPSLMVAVADAVAMSTIPSLLIPTYPINVYDKLEEKELAYATTSGGLFPNTIDVSDKVGVSEGASVPSVGSNQALRSGNMGISMGVRVGL